VNRPQKWVLAMGLLATAALLVFPPWRTVFVGGRYPPGDWSEGFSFLLTPPSPSPHAYQYHSVLHVRIDRSRLLSLLAVNAGTFLGILWVFRLGDGESVVPVGAFVEKRRLATATLLALGMPVPPLGPVAYAVPSIFVEGGHVWFGALLFEAVCFICLFALTYLILTFAPKFFPRAKSFIRPASPGASES